MLVEAQRQEIEKQEIQNEIALLEKQVEIGKSAERMTVHPDWKRYCTRLTEKLRGERQLTLEQYAMIFDDAVTEDQIRKSVDRARQMQAAMQQLYYFIELPEKEAANGVAAAKRLEELRRTQ